MPIYNINISYMSLLIVSLHIYTVLFFSMFSNLSSSVDESSKMVSCKTQQKSFEYKLSTVKPHLNIRFHQDPWIIPWEINRNVEKLPILQCHIRWKNSLCILSHPYHILPSFHVVRGNLSSIFFVIILLLTNKCWWTHNLLGHNKYLWTITVCHFNTYASTLATAVAGGILFSGCLSWRIFLNWYKGSL